MSARKSLFAMAAGLGCAAGCLGIGAPEEGPTQKGGAGGNGGSGVGDGGWPDATGGLGGTGGSAGTGATGGVAGSVAAGGTGGGSGGTPGSGGTGGSGGSAPSWNLYAYDASTGAWSASVPLSAAWGSPNSPNSGIAAAVMLEHFDRLLVFGGDGNFYLRADGVWQPPVAINTKFPALAGLTVQAVYHVASPPNAPIAEGITFSANPVAVLYDYKSNDSVVFQDKVTMKDDPAPAAPQASGTILWDFEIRDPKLIGTAGYYRGYYGYANGNLYQFDAAFVWQSWPYSQSPFFKGKANAPDPLAMRAAYFDAALNRAVLIGP